MVDGRCCLLILQPPLTPTCSISPVQSSLRSQRSTSKDDAAHALMAVIYVYTFAATPGIASMRSESCGARGSAEHRRAQQRQRRGEYMQKRARFRPFRGHAPNQRCCETYWHRPLGLWGETTGGPASHHERHEVSRIILFIRGCGTIPYSWGKQRLCHYPS